MNERNELADLIDSNRRRVLLAPSGESGVSVAFTSSEEQADAILAAGYRKLRTIKTVEELDALKWGSIVRDAEDDAWQRHGGRWNVSGGNPVGEDLPTLPATVLWEPR